MEVRQTQATLMVVAATVLWSLMAPISRGLFGAGFDPLTTVMIRSVGGGILLAVVLSVVRKRWSVIDKKDWLLALGYGVFIAANYLTYFQSFAVGTVTVATVTLHTYPVIVLIGARVLYGESVSMRAVVAVVMCVIGVLLLTNALDPKQFVVNAAGAGWGLVSAVMLAGHVLIAKRLVAKYDQFTVVKHGLLVAGAVLFTGWLFVPGDIAITMETSLLLAGLIVGSTIGAYCLFVSAIRVLPVSRSGIITLSETVFVMAWGRILGESISALQYVGAGIILGGVAGVIRPDNKVTASVEYARGD